MRLKCYELNNKNVLDFLCAWGNGEKANFVHRGFQTFSAYWNLIYLSTQHFTKQVD